MENGKTGIINPFVHISDKLEEKQITKAFLHPGDEGYDSEMIGSKHVVNALAYGTENTVAEKTPIAKAFLHEGDDGFDKAMSFADIEIAMLDKPIFIPSEGTKATSQGQNKATNEGSNMIFVGVQRDALFVVVMFTHYSSTKPSKKKFLPI